jgi:hypothetical protein
MLRLSVAFLIMAIAICGSAMSQTQEPAGAAPKPDVDTAPVAPKSDYPFDSFTEFSALKVGAQFGGHEEANVYRSGNLFRNKMPDGTYMVTDLATREAWGVARDWCAHFAAPSAQAYPFIPLAPGSRVERTPVTQEVWNGHSCHVEDVTVTSAQGGGASGMRIWEADDLQGFPIKVALHPDKNGPVIEFKNVFLVAQDESLFQHPTKCEPPVMSEKQLKGNKSGANTHKATPKPPAPPQ